MLWCLNIRYIDCRQDFVFLMSACAYGWWSTDMMKCGTKRKNAGVVEILTGLNDQIPEETLQKWGEGKREKQLLLQLQQFADTSQLHSSLCLEDATKRNNFMLQNWSVNTVTVTVLGWRIRFYSINLHNCRRTFGHRVVSVIVFRRNLHCKRHQGCHGAITWKKNMTRSTLTFIALTCTGQGNPYQSEQHHHSICLSGD